MIKEYDVSYLNVYYEDYTRKNLKYDGEVVFSYNGEWYRYSFDNEDSRQKYDKEYVFIYPLDYKDYKYYSNSFEPKTIDKRLLAHFVELYKESGENLVCVTEGL